MEYKFTAENYNTEVAGSNVPVMIDFYADWCGPCRMMMPIVEEMAEKYDGRIKIGKVNVDEQQALAAKFNVMSIPTFVFIKDGQVVNTAIGGMPKGALAEKLDALV